MVSYKPKMKTEPIIKMVGIRKAFAGVVANDDVDFDLYPGEIHCVLGENGAGKTTLMSILTGMHQPDEGAIFIRDKKIQIRSPQDSLRFGIGMVYQHFTLIPNLSVTENLILGFEGGFFLNLKKATHKIQKISNTYGLSIDPKRKIQDLTINERQRTEILKILFHESDVLILDEPTSMLSPGEVESLFQLLKTLRNSGKSVVLVTHNLNEAIEIADRITIMRSGRKAAELSRESLRSMDTITASNKILSLMFGMIPQPETTIESKSSANESVLELSGVGVLNSRGLVGLKGISFSVNKSEIIGITGVDSEGPRLLAEVIGGQKPAYSGTILYHGVNITHMDTAKRFDMGISYITDDRINEGCVIDMALSDNSILQNYSRQPFARLGVLYFSSIKSFTSDLIKKFGIQTTGPEAHIRTLSGGNIQKFILARGLSGAPGLIVCNNPTYGLDAKTVRFIRKLIIEESQRGTAVLLITTDLDELFSCCHRILVLFKGEILELMDRRDATTEKVGKLMLGYRS